MNWMNNNMKSWRFHEEFDFVIPHFKIRGVTLVLPDK